MAAYSATCRACAPLWAVLTACPQNRAASPRLADSALTPRPGPRHQRGHRGANNLLKPVKRVAFGFTRFRDYCIRACSTPASPTGNYSPQSPQLPREI